MRPILLVLLLATPLVLSNCASPLAVDKSGELRQEIRPGMTKAEVTALLGKPQAMTQRTPFAVSQPGMPEAMKASPMMRAAEQWMYLVSNQANMYSRLQPLAAVPVLGGMMIRQQIREHGQQTVTLTVYFDEQGRVVDSQRNMTSINP